jgi:hypothetical protein
MNDFISFDKMITPALIKIIFWLGVGVSALMGLILIISGAGSRYGGGAQVVMGLIVLVLGPLFTRIYCELLIVIFKIHESLISINNKVNKDNV